MTEKSSGSTRILHRKRVIKYATGCCGPSYSAGTYFKIPKSKARMSTIAARSRATSSPGARRLLAVAAEVGRSESAVSRGLGDREAGTVAGKSSGARLATPADGRSRLLVGGEAESRKSRDANRVIAAALAGQPLEPISPDRGKEFAAHAEVTDELGAGFCFALPHHPWQRGTDENANGLLR